MGGGQTTEFLLVAVKFILFLNVFFGLIFPRRDIETVTAREYCDSLLSTFSTKTTFHTFSSDLQTIQQFLFGVDMSSCGDMCHYGWNGESWDSYDTRKGDEHLYNLLRPGMYCVNVTIHFKK